MADTAAGLFASAAEAEMVSRSLKDGGFPAEGIRIVTGPRSATVDSVTSTPEVDFAAGIARDLRAIGASDAECESFLTGIRNGNALIFATGTVDQAKTAMDIMNQHGAIETEEYAGAVPSVSSTAIHGFEGAGDISSKEHRLRARTEGAKIFSW